MKQVLMGLLLMFVSMGAAMAEEGQVAVNNTKNLAASNIVVKAPQIRLLPNDSNAAVAFMELDNKSNKSATLIAAYSMTANQTLLHKYTEKNDAQVMKSIDKIKINPNSNTKLEFDGKHVMLLNLKQTLHKGDAVPIVLIFNDGSNLTVRANVEQ